MGMTILLHFSSTRNLRNLHRGVQRPETQVVFYALLEELQCSEPVQHSATAR